MRVEIFVFNHETGEDDNLIGFFADEVSVVPGLGDNTYYHVILSPDQNNIEKILDSDEDIYRIPVKNPLPGNEHIIYIKTHSRGNIIKIKFSGK